MYGVRHYLHEDFPELDGTLATLKSSNPQFAQLVSEYDQTDKRIYGIEISSRPVADHYVDGLKRKRLLLKDRIYRLLTRHRG